MNITNERLRELAEHCDEREQANREVASDFVGLSVEPHRNWIADHHRDCAAALRAVLAVRELAAEMLADDAINAAAIEKARREGNRHHEHELIGAKRDTHAWRMKLRAIVGADAGDGR